MAMLVLLQGDIAGFRATRMIQYGVTALEKDPAILCGLRLVLNHPSGSECSNITLQENWGPTGMVQSKSSLTK